MNLQKKEVLPLLTEDIPYFFYGDKLSDLKMELEEFLNGPGKYMNDRVLAEKFLDCLEIQANNSVEGYNDDVKIIENVISGGYSQMLSENRRQIIHNLYVGYQRILRGDEINPDTLRCLYDDLSFGLLSSSDISEMGQYYRTKPVDIWYSRNMAKEPDSGIDEKLVPMYMNSLFEYLNNDNDLETPTDYFIKSQIAHYYFVYVHPYFDVNGRTGRTLAMWYLINNETYPYVIFNRAITLSKNKYYKVIRDVKKFHNATYFLNFMMENVKVELEKEYLINSINHSVRDSLTVQEYQTLQYVLSMKGVKTSKDFATFYNRLNRKKSFDEIDSEMLMPLIEKDVLQVTRYTKKGLDNTKRNYVFDFNEDMVDNDPSKIKRLKIKKSTD